MRAKEYKIEIKNSILDNVHGFIGLTEVENQVERLPIFKRLQNISQLGLSHRIFPCALHNRYIHSLGVLYIVDQMAIKLNIFNDNERQLLRLAGMLHDIGHYPLSHDIEYVYKSCANIQSLGKRGDLDNFISCKNNAKNSIDKLKPIKKISDFYLNGLNSDNRHHENIGAKVLKNSSEIKKIIKEFYVEGNSFYQTLRKKYTPNKTNDQIVDMIIDEISAIITGNAQYPNSLFPDKFSIMVQLMHSEIDADRIDYLLRDATFSGASYGTFDFGLLIQTLEFKDYQQTKIVGVNLKGIGCAEQFLINRYLAYNQVINHKYTSIIGCILQTIVKWLITDGSEGYRYSDIISLVETYEIDSKKDYLYFTDDCLTSFINNLDENNGKYPKDIRILLRCLKAYQAFNLSSEEIVVGNDESDIAQTLKDSDLYKRMIKCNDSNIDKIYQYRDISITSHVPIEIFNKRLDAAKITDRSKRERYYIDRLQDGAAIIEDGKDPYLLVDSNRSMLHKIYGIKYSILREYDFSNFNDKGTKSIK